MKEKQLGENDFNKSLPKLRGKCQVQESNYGSTALTQVRLFFSSYFIPRSILCTIYYSVPSINTSLALVLSPFLSSFSTFVCDSNPPPTATLLIAVPSDFV